MFKPIGDLVPGSELGPSTRVWLVKDWYSQLYQRLGYSRYQTLTRVMSTGCVENQSRVALPPVVADASVSIDD